MFSIINRQKLPRIGSQRIGSQERSEVENTVFQLFDRFNVVFTLQAMVEVAQHDR